MQGSAYTPSVPPEFMRDLWAPAGLRYAGTETLIKASNPAAPAAPRAST